MVPTMYPIIADMIMKKRFHDMFTVSFPKSPASVGVGNAKRRAIIQKAVI
jgi:hypothetical protein